MTEENVGFDVNEETVVHDLGDVKEQKSLTPVAKGVRVRIEKIAIRKNLENNKADAGPENRWTYKALNPTFRIIDGIEVDVVDDAGNVTGKELKYKNKPLFPASLDLVFAHNAEVKTSDWWKNRQYAIGFKQFCKALKIDLKEIRVNDEFCLAHEGRELLLDIRHEPTQSKNEKGEWVDDGGFRERLCNFLPWE